MRVMSGGGRPPTRGRSRAVSVAAGMGALVMAVSSCGGSGEDGDTVELRFSWWGSDERHETLQEVIEVFEEENPDIRIAGDYTDWDSYWDRLATSTAANDAPDIVMQDEQYLREYAERGAMVDLDELGDELDLSDMDPLIADSGDLDGQTFGAATGVNAYPILADPEAFEEAGVDMPDDETWTWDDYVEVATEISEATDGEIVGTQSMAYNETGLQTFARQHGENLYTDDGELAFSQETAEAWFQVTMDLQDSGGQPDADSSVEIDAGGPDQSVIATNDGAMAHFWSNQLGAISTAADREVELLRYPGESEHERTGMFFKPAMYYSVSAESDYPEESARFIDFMLNEVEPSEMILADLGLPANVEVRDAVLDDLPDADARGAEFLEEIEDSIVDGNPPPPTGSSEVEEITERLSNEMKFGDLTPAEAAEQLIAESEEVIAAE